MSNGNFEQDLQQQIRDLETTKLPQRDLWPGIEVALTKQESAEPKGSPFRPVAVAASVLLVGVLTWFGGQQVLNSPPSGEELVANLSQQHQQQKQALLVKFQDQPALTQNWETQLSELDDAAKAIKAALQQDPNNMALLKMLQNVHQQQIDLIERVHSTKWQQI